MNSSFYTLHYHDIEDTYYAVPEGFSGSVYTPVEDPEDPDAVGDLKEGVIDLETWDKEEAERKLALMISDATNSVPDDKGHNIFGWGNREFLVVTDDEADELWDEDLENYLDECVVCELPENLQHYFDRDAWKRDARIDGRAHSLSWYDGNEDCVTVDGTEYYIYRTS
jgi:hypothetical protein